MAKHTMVPRTATHHTEKPRTGPIRRVGSGGASVRLAAARSRGGAVGDGVDLEPSAQLSIGRPITLHVSHSFERLSFEGGRIFTQNLLQSQMSYHFDVRTFLRAIVQYEDVSRNADVYTFPVEPHDRNLFTQFLFSYKLNPQTVAFVGYSDNRVGSANIRIRQTNRTFFVRYLASPNLKMDPDVQALHDRVDAINRIKAEAEYIAIVLGRLTYVLDAENRRHYTRPSSRSTISPACSNPHFSRTRVEGLGVGRVCARTRRTQPFPNANATPASAASVAYPRHCHFAPRAATPTDQLV